MRHTLLLALLLTLLLLPTALRADGFSIFFQTHPDAWAVGPVPDYVQVNVLELSDTLTPDTVVQFDFYSDTTLIAETTENMVDAASQGWSGAGVATAIFEAPGSPQSGTIVDWSYIEAGCADCRVDITLVSGEIDQRGWHLQLNQTTPDGFFVNSAWFDAQDPDLPESNQVPEPGTLALVGSGLLGIAALKKHHGA